MKHEWKFIGFDLGAESGRCFTAILTREKIYLHEVHRFSTHTLKTDSSIHWNTGSIFEDILNGLAKARDEFGSYFDGIAIDTCTVHYVLVNPDGGDAGYPYQYRDNRTDRIMEEAFSVVPKDELYYHTGTQPAQYNTLFQLVAEKKSKAGLIDKADKLLLMPDYFNFRLTGVKRSEFTIASTTNLTDPHSRDWSWRIIDSFGLPRNIFPEMIEPGTRLGTLLPDVADKTGLSISVPVFAAAGHDTASAAASIPSTGTGWAFLSSGTWSLLGIEVNKPVLNSAALKYNFTNEGGYNKTVTFLKNIVGLWPLQECRREWIKSGEEITYPELSSLAGKYGLSNVWIDLSDPRFLKQGEMLKKISDYICETKQKNSEGKGFFTGVILESLAYSYRKTIKQIEEITGIEIDTIHMVGGGIKNKLLTQYTADATGKTVLAGPVEGAVLGNIGIQAIAAGSVKDLKELRGILASAVPLKKYLPFNTAYFNDNENKYDRIINTKKGENN